MLRLRSLAIDSDEISSHRGRTTTTAIKLRQVAYLSLFAAAA
jgi:hypothetical protein